MGQARTPDRTEAINTNWIEGVELSLVGYETIQKRFEDTVVFRRSPFANNINMNIDWRKISLQTQL